jgi:hypothetical protein
MPLERERWLMTAVFDSVEETKRAGMYEGGPGEAAGFYEHCKRQATDEWGFLPEDVPEGVELDGDTVRVTLNMIDPFGELFGWLIAWTSPVSVTLERTEGRG